VAPAWPQRWSAASPRWDDGWTARDFVGDRRRCAVHAVLGEARVLLEMQKFLGTHRHEHGADHAGVVTTTRFSQPARDLGTRRGVTLVDRSAFAERMARGTSVTARPRSPRDRTRCGDATGASDPRPPQPVGPTSPPELRGRHVSDLARTPRDHSAGRGSEPHRAHSTV